MPEKAFSVCIKDSVFIDPACKTGVFLREIAKRLLIGLEPVIPDLQGRIDHIFKKQLYGIAITELTSLLSRRSLYCSKYPNGEYSVCRFNNPDGNIRFKKIQHTWEGRQCKYCGASKNQYDRSFEKESYAYEFIHMLEPEEVYKMKFDVIISNPPYQLSDGGAAASAKPIYQLFIQQAKKLDPRFITMIVPSRWFSGGKGLDDFRKETLSDHRFTKIIDYPNAQDCFTGVDIAGGVCYFLYDRENPRKNCIIKTILNNEESIAERPLDEFDIFVRWNDGVSIVRKVLEKKELTYDTIASARKPFGLATNFDDYYDRPSRNTYKLYISNQVGKRDVKYVDKKMITKGNDKINKWKVMIPNAFRIGSVTDGGMIHPIIAEPESVTTETFILFDSFDTKEEAENCLSYVTTKFFRFLVYLRKVTHHAPSTVYAFVPVQEYDNKWDDKKLYEKYMLTEKEISFIENMINPYDSSWED